MSNDIRNIIERLAILEGRITPVDVKHGLNADQKAVKQLPALFKPRDISPTLSKTPYQKHPMDGWLVGEEELADEEADKEVIEEAKVDEEKLLDKVKKSLTDYLQSVEEKLEKKIDRDLGEKPADKDIGKKDKEDRELVAKEKEKEKEKELDEDPTQEDPVIQTPTLPQQDPTYAESYAVKTIEMAPGKICEIHGNEKLGFEIRHGNRKLPSRFRNLDEAVMAVEMFCSRQHKQVESQDYMEEK